MKCTFCMTAYADQDWSVLGAPRPLCGPCLAQRQAARGPRGEAQVGQSAVEAWKRWETTGKQQVYLAPSDSAVGYQRKRLPRRKGDSGATRDPAPFTPVTDDNRR